MSEGPRRTTGGLADNEIEPLFERAELESERAFRARSGSNKLWIMGGLVVVVAVGFVALGSQRTTTPPNRANEEPQSVPAVAASPKEVAPVKASLPSAPENAKAPLPAAPRAQATPSPSGAAVHAKPAAAHKPAHRHAAPRPTDRLPHLPSPPPPDENP